MDNLKNELARRAADGREPVTVAYIGARLAELGYKLDRSGDCRHVARYVTGEHAGESYPAISTTIREIDSGLTFANVNARRDANFRTLQNHRIAGDLFAVVNGSILEI